MMTSNARFAVVAAALVLLAWTLYERVYEVSALVALGIAYLIWSYFRQGTVSLAAKAYHNRDYIKAGNLLREIQNPDRLAKSRRGYYEFILGNIELRNENFQSAETHFQIASRFPLKNQNDKGIVLVQLANLNLRKKEFAKAQAYLDVAKGLKLSVRVNNIVERIQHEIQKAK